MRIAAAGARKRRAGFTLLELLVVMSIIGVLSTTLVILVQPGDGTLARTEARRLAALLELALAEARATGRSMAWSPEHDAYSFWQRTEDGDWIRFPDSSVFRRRVLPRATELREVSIDAQNLPEGERVVLSPYGVRGALEAAVSAGNARYAVRAGVLGRVSTHSDSHAGTDPRRPPAGARIHPG